MKDGYYKFLAIGRDDIDEPDDYSNMTMSEPSLDYPGEYPENFVEELNENASMFSLPPQQYPAEIEGEWTSGTTTLENATLTVKSLSGGVTELFSGLSDKTAEVTPSTVGFTTSIQMDRFVAGILMYVKNIPSKLSAMATVDKYNSEFGEYDKLVEKGKEYDVHAIGISLTNWQRDFSLLTRKAVSTSSVGINTQLKNTTVQAELQSYSIDSEGYYQINNTGLQENSVLEGGFCTPQNAPSRVLTIGPDKNNPDYSEGEESTIENNTLMLVFFSTIAGNERVPIYWIPIKCVYDNKYNSSDDDYIGSEHPQESAYNYNIDANSFYSLGKKNYATQEDEPIDLKEYFENGGEGGEIVIKVYPNWDWTGNLEWQ